MNFLLANICKKNLKIKCFTHIERNLFSDVEVDDDVDDVFAVVENIENGNQGNRRQHPLASSGITIPIPAPRFIASNSGRPMISRKQISVDSVSLMDEIAETLGEKFSFFNRKVLFGP